VPPHFAQFGSLVQLSLLWFHHKLSIFLELYSYLTHVQGVVVCNNVLEEKYIVQSCKTGIQFLSPMEEAYSL
jgi:hypothetical protein